VRGLAGSDLVSAPGAEYHYTNTGYDVLGLIVQTISGQPFSDYIEQHVFTPLDMRHSHATVESARADGLAAGYYNWFGISWQPYTTPLPRAGGPSATMFVSAEDLGHELVAQLDGGTYGAARVLSAAGIATMHTPGVKVDAFHGYAMGWGLRPLWEALDPTAPGGGPAFTLPGLVEHGGGWPNAHTFVALVPGEGWGVALLVNAADFAQSSRFSLLDQNILRILEGSEPVDWTPGEELLSRYGRLVAALLLVAQLVSLAWSFRALRLTRAMAGGVGSRSLVIKAVAALALDVLIVWLLLAYVPEHYESTFSVLLRESPDLAVLGLPALALAVIWGPLRTVLLLTGIVRSRRPTGSAVPA
jgi:CubicO group peptidase (beta-lactamase class C family)